MAFSCSGMNGTANVFVGISSCSTKRGRYLSAICYAPTPPRRLRPAEEQSFAGPVKLCTSRHGR
jgi:hypothetical protein